MTTAEKAARRVYSAEQLHRLRASSSAPKLREAIEEHDGEDAELVKALTITSITRQSAIPFLDIILRPLTMSKYQHEDGLEFHRQWVQQVIETPSPQKHTRNDDEYSLTVNDSPTEHVLRGSKSFTARSFHSRAHVNSVHFTSGKHNDENIAVYADASQDQPPPPVIATSKPHILGEIANNALPSRSGHWRLRTSPTPSIRKTKIEALVKHHGSPQHVRVTAGGRIVPSEQSPLCHPRFGYSAIKSNGALIKVAPNHGAKTQWESTTQDGFVAQDVNGRLCQIVNGMVMPLNEENGAVRLYIPAPNLNITQPAPGSSMAAPAVADQHGFSNRHASDSQAATASAPQPTIATQQKALEGEYSNLEHELKELNKTEVLHGTTMAKSAKDALFTKRRELVTNMDRVRKALKSLKDLQQEAPVPTSPKAMRDRQSMSPQRDRLPPFIQRARQSNSVSAPPVQVPWQPMGQPVYGSASSLPAGPMFGVPAMANPNGLFPALPYQIPPPGMFMPPPPFDGSMGAPFPVHQDPATGATFFPAASAPVPQPGASNGMQPGDQTIPQNDGSTSSSDPKVSSPRQSHALPIRDPGTKQVANVKSALNPMSPVYKPNNGPRQHMGADRPGSKHVDDRAPTPLALLHASNPAARPSADSESHASPVKCKIVVDSSSVSSVKTADFFPRNTREYSMRKHEYPTDESEEKENVEPDHCRRPRITGSQSPITPKRDLHNTNWNPEIPDGAFVKFASPQTESYAAPTVPPGTPVHGRVEAEGKLAIDGSAWSEQIQYLNSAQMPDRVAHNLSPKNKRTWRFVEEHPSRYGSEEKSSSSPAEDHQCLQDFCSSASPYKAVELASKSRSWIEGYQAGLYRKPVGADRMGDFVDGYCAGLHNSQPVTSVSMGISDGSPAKPASRRPTPIPTQTIAHSSDRSTENTSATRPPMELNLQSLDSLKQAVYAPQNENALMTPALDSFQGNEGAFHLGSWQKRHETAGGAVPHHPVFPQRSSSLMDRPTIHGQQAESGGNPGPDAKGTLQKAAPIPYGQQHLQTPGAPTLAAVQPRATSGPVRPANRVLSVTSIDSTLHRPWAGSGPRVISPFDWKSSSSVAHAANLATGFFAHSQYDGTAMDLDSDETAILTHAAGFSGIPNKPGAPAPKTWQHRGASLDGVDSPITSPTGPQATSPNLSPAASPRLKPTRSKKSTDSPSKKSSPTKSPSPAKAKFEHIARKVGISVSAENREQREGSGGASPPYKKTWKHIWAGSKKNGSKDEGTSTAASPAH
ncbi:hypothetical protein Q7P37_006965 [Cladosporium fusiforme]